MGRDAAGEVDCQAGVFGEVVMLNFAKVGDKGEMVPMHSKVVYEIRFGLWGLLFELRRLDYVGHLVFESFGKLYKDFDTVISALPKGLERLPKILTDPPSLLAAFTPKEGHVAQW